MLKEFDNPSKKLEVSKDASFLTRGTSMEPLFHQHRDIINISKNFDELKRGDVVLYSALQSNDLILHRVIGVRGEELLIRGDNTYFIEYRKKSEILGIMVSFFRKGKYCDCKNSKVYKFYTTWTLNTYFLRWLWVKAIRPVLAKTAKAVLRLLGINYKKK